MYLWAGLFSGAVVGLSVVRTELIWLAIVTVAALAALLVATVPQMRPWRFRVAKAPSATPPSPSLDAPDPVAAGAVSSYGFASAPVDRSPGIAYDPNALPGDAYAPNGLSRDAYGANGLSRDAYGANGLSREVTESGDLPRRAGDSRHLPGTGVPEADEPDETRDASAGRQTEPVPPWALSDFPVPPRSARR